MDDNAMRMVAVGEAVQDISYRQSVRQLSDVPHTDDNDRLTGTSMLCTEDGQLISDSIISNNTPLLKEPCSRFHDQDYAEKIKEFQSYVDMKVVIAETLPVLDETLEEMFADNDFNNLFKLLSYDEVIDCNKKRQCLLYGLPASFYSRLFPTKSLHFAYSSYSLHWLSQVPEGLENKNKENIYMARTSPPEVFEAYAKQYERDLSTFLKSRAKEIIAGGRMVLTFVGRSFEDPSCKDDYACFTLLSKTLLDMVVEGLVKMDDLYSFNLPIYTPCKQEVEKVIQNEGSFNLNKMHVFRVRWDAHDDNIVNDDLQENPLFFDKHRSAKLVADCIRAFMEPMVACHFGGSIVDELFRRYAEKLAEHLSIEKSSYFTILISLCRR
ncbi:hypothetical protein DH2020_023430 [Rehmannia glutinosa]|uniref:Uncharacterized protein n=1 Tax=Rehmannia glutinosa TaxID=99300 RepID=A0ABR0W9Z5_REHGL